MYPVNHYRTENDRDTARSSHRLHDRPAIELMAFAVIQVGRYHDHRDFQFFKCLGSQMAFQEIPETFAVEQAGLGKLELCKFGKFTACKEFFQLVCRIAVGKQSSH